MSIRGDLMGRIDDMRDTLVQDLIELVSIPTVNPPGENYEKFCVFARDLAREFGCELELVYVPEAEAERRYPWGKGHRRVSILGRYRKSRRTHEGMHLSGHLDTVPAGRGWTKNPWKPMIENGKLYGLGVSDMKGGIASILGVLRAFHDLGLEINGDLTFSFTPDEESGGMAGVGWLADQGMVKARYGIITEPSQPHLVKINVVPDYAMMTIDRRLILEESVEEAYREIEETIRQVQNDDPQLEVSLKRTLGLSGSAVAADSVIATTLATCHQE